MKAKEIGTLETKTRLSQILSQVERGQHFHITRHGKPVAQLTPINKSAKGPAFGCGKRIFSHVAADFDAPIEDFKPYTD